MYNRSRTLAGMKLCVDMWLGIGRIVCYMGLMVVRRLHSRQSDLIVSRCQYECNDYNVTMLDATMARLR